MTSFCWAYLIIKDNLWIVFLSITGDNLNAAAKKAFESLFFITLTVPGGESWDNFTSEVIHRAQIDYNFTYDEEVLKYFCMKFILIK